jgi:hypothetical protein
VNIPDAAVEAACKAWDEGVEAGAILQHHIEAAKQSGAEAPGPIFNPYRERS